MKYLLVLLAGFILAQGMEYGACELISYHQKVCHSLHAEDREECENSPKIAQFTETVLSFNFIYTGRKLIWGY